jgi:hypothetical protein
MVSLAYLVIPSNLASISALLNLPCSSKASKSDLDSSLCHILIWLDQLTSSQSLDGLACLRVTSATIITLAQRTRRDSYSPHWTDLTHPNIQYMHWIRLHRGLPQLQCVRPVLQILSRFFSRGSICHTRAVWGIKAGPLRSLFPSPPSSSFKPFYHPLSLSLHNAVYQDHLGPLSCHLCCRCYSASGQWVSWYVFLELMSTWHQLDGPIVNVEGVDVDVLNSDLLDVVLWWYFLLYDSILHSGVNATLMSLAASSICRDIWTYVLPGPNTHVKP